MAEEKEGGTIKNIKEGTRWRYYNIDIDRRYIKEKNVEKGKGYTSVAEEGERERAREENRLRANGRDDEVDVWG